MTQPLTRSGELNMGGKDIPQPTTLDAMVASSPLGRLGTPDEAAGAVLFFCCPLSDYVTVEVLTCGGSYHF